MKRTRAEREVVVEREIKEMTGKKKKLTEKQLAQRRKQQELNRIDLVQLKNKMSTSKRIFWTIDPGTSKPAFLRVDASKKLLEFYFYRFEPFHRHSRFVISKGVFEGWQVSITCLERPTDTQINKYGTFARTASIQALQEPILQMIAKDKGCVVVIEGYAYSIRQGSSASMFEFGGILRARLSNMRHPIIELPILQNKKNFTGYGKSDKIEMMESFLLYFEMPDFRPMLGFKTCTQKTPPKPFEDLIDVFSFAVWALHQ